MTLNPKRQKAADSAWTWISKQREPFSPMTLWKATNQVKKYEWIRKWVWFWRDHGRLERTENGYFFKRPLQACSKGLTCKGQPRAWRKVA